MFTIEKEDQDGLGTITYLDPAEEDSWLPTIGLGHPLEDPTRTRLMIADCYGNCLGVDMDDDEIDQFVNELLAAKEGR